MIRVLLCSPFDDGNPIHTGGIALWAKNLFDYYLHSVDKSLVTLTVAPCNRSNFADLNTSFIIRLWRGLKDYHTIIHRIKQEISLNKYDVIHICSSASLGLFKDIILLKIAQRRKIKSVLHFRFGRIPDLLEINNWECKLLKCAAKLAGTVIVIDKNSFMALKTAKIDNVELLPNPLQKRTLSIIDKFSSAKRIKNQILYVGHVIPTKGVRELIEATKLLKNKELIIAGFGENSYIKELHDFAGEGHEEWLSFIGHQNYENTIQQMLRCDVFVLPSYTEGFPNVILEAMACGCPIIATEVGAIPDMLETDNVGSSCGVLVPPKNSTAIFNALNRMLCDEGFRNNCGDLARERVKQRYSIEQIWSSMYNIWKATLTN